MLGDGGFAIIMEQPKGPDMFDDINDRERSIDDSVAQFLFAQVFHIVIKCYQNGILHRDTKDEDIMLGENDKLKLTDYGIATLVNVNDGGGKLRRMEETRHLRHLGTSKPVSVMRSTEWFGNLVRFSTACWMGIYHSTAIWRFLRITLFGADRAVLRVAICSDRVCDWTLSPIRR